MKSRFRTPLLKHLCAVATGLLLLTAAAIAQNDWQAAYDPSLKNASARGGIAYLPNNGGSVTAGEMQIYNTTTDIYIIKHDACGNPVWQYSYDIGNIDSCRKIRATPDGGFIVVGTTQHLFPIAIECSAPGTVHLNQIFLMKINSLGAVIWTKTYGKANAEEGRDVQVIPNGYIVTGTTRSYGAGGADGLIMKTDTSGSLITAGTWARTYGGPLDDYFLSCGVTANGDILAVGGTRNYTVGNTDVFLVRVSAATGAPVFMENYGTTSIDAGWRVLECTNTTYKREIAVCGYTTHFGGSADGLILITDSIGVLLRSHHYSGTATTTWDEFTDMMELGNASRDLMVTGTSFLPVGGFGNYDVYVGQVNRTTFAPVNTLLFGGPFDDQGWAITRNPLSTGNGFQVAGSSYRIHPTSPSNLDVYVISRPNMTARGCDAALNPIHGNASLTSVPANSWVHALVTIDTCALHVEATLQYDYEQICGECSPTRIMQNGTPSIGEWRAPGAREAANPADLNVSSAGKSAEAPIGLYPNPVKSGSSFTFALPAGSSSVEITVTDMSGKMIHTATASGSEVSIDTDGWSSGVYAIRLNRNGTTVTRQIVVTE